MYIYIYTSIWIQIQVASWKVWLGGFSGTVWMSNPTMGFSTKTVPTNDKESFICIFIYGYIYIYSTVGVCSTIKLHESKSIGSFTLLSYGLSFQAMPESFL